MRRSSNMFKKKESSPVQPEEQEDNCLNIEEDEAKVQEAINTLRSLVAEEKDLKVRMDDAFMLRYLRAHHFRPKESFEKMVKLYKFKAKHENFFCTTWPSDCKEVLSQNIMTMLEERDQRGRRIFYVKVDRVDTRTLSLEKCNRFLDLWAELAMEEEDTQKNGVAYLVDFCGFPLQLLRWMKPKTAIVSGLKQEVTPWKNMDMYFVNTSKLIDGLVAIVYPFFSTKYKEQMHFLGKDWSALHKILDPKILPEEYGGQSGEINYAKMQRYLLDNEGKLRELFSLGYAKT